MPSMVPMPWYPIIKKTFEIDISSRWSLGFMPLSPTPRAVGTAMSADGLVKGTQEMTKTR